jgi:ABC-type amino acid transport substrate-binding protein
MSWTLIALLLTQWLTAMAQVAFPTETTTSDTRTPLVVATRHVPPFAIKDEEGNWSGISIDLLREIVLQLNENSQQQFDLELREMSLKEMLAALENGDVDLAAAALTVNFQREQKMDFSHPFYNSGLGIAVEVDKRSGWLLVIERIFSWTFLEILAGLFGLLCISGLCIYIFERRRNREQFGGSFWRGLGAGIWWSIVTLTTVGYGDKAPKTAVGRMIAVMWMLSGILVVSAFTASITSALTVGQLRSRLSGPGDLPRVRVATVSDSTSQSYLQSRHIRFEKFAELPDALSALDEGQVDAVVYDAPLLRYQALQDHPRASVLNATFETQDYAIAMPSGSPLREQVNQALLRVISQRWWEETLRDYLGQR